MIPDVRFPAGQWVDLYAQAGIAVGTKLVIVNKLQQLVLVFIGVNPPAVGVSDGFPLLYAEPAQVTAGSPGCWVMMADGAGAAQGRVCVQEGSL